MPPPTPQNVHAVILICRCKQVANPGVVGHPISEGMILIMALLPTLPESSVNIADLESAVRDFLAGQGDVFAFQSLGLMDQPVWKALVEFSDVDVAIAVASKFNGIFFENVCCWHCSTPMALGGRAYGDNVNRVSSLS